MFAHWIKNRIESFDFQDGKDYAIIEYDYKGDIILGNGNSDNQVHKREYGLMLDMAKELCMIENNDRGREVRKYFIEMEQNYSRPIPSKSWSRKQVAHWIIENEV